MGQWEKARSVTFASTRSVNLWKLHQKILLHWYLTPYRLSKFTPGLSSRCWRECGQLGTLPHILWLCPCIKNYWTDIFNLIGQVTGIKLGPSQGMALLLLGIDLIPTRMRTIVSHILLAARLTLVRHWRDRTPPGLAETLQIINTHGTYEIQFAFSTGKHLTISEFWSHWKTWYSQYRGSYTSDK